MARCCMYGPYFTIPIVSMFFALIFTFIATVGCRFFEVEYGGDVLGIDVGVRKFGIGLFYVEEIDPTILEDDSGDDCVSWYAHSFFQGEDSVDTPLRFARFISLLSALVVLFSFAILLCASCVQLPKQLRVGIGGTFLVLGPLFWLTLAAKATTTCQTANSCALGGGGFLAVIVPFVWLLAGYGVLTMKEKFGTNASGQPTATAIELPTTGHTAAPPNATITEVVQEIVEPNGTLTRIITRTVINPDGSRTVTETRQSTTPAAAAQSGEEPLTPYAVAAAPVVATVVEDLPKAKFVKE